jgi:pimeloyl-ACP methyl ester carboxylesterase
MGRVEVDGVGVEYEVTGTGRPVVLLHGFPDSGRLWRHQVPALAEAGFQVVVPDLRGYGRSGQPEPVDAYSLPLLAGDVLAVLAELGIDQAHVVGHDWGAALAWVLGSLAPGNVDHLVTLSVGHPATFRRTLEQLEKSWYMLLFQFPGIAESWLTQDGWANFRSWGRHPDADAVIAELEANGSLTPGLNWYRANVPPESWGGPAAAAPAHPGADDGRVEHGGLRAHRDSDDGLGGERRGHLAVRAPGGARSLDAAGRARPGERAAARLPARLRPVCGRPGDKGGGRAIRAAAG